MSIIRVANIRGLLAGAVLPQDQILLLGPPYKVPKDSTLQSEEVLHALQLGDKEDDPFGAGPSNMDTSVAKPRLLSETSSERSGARRLFLFSRQALSENAPEPIPCRLEPMSLQLPTEAPGPSPLNFSQQPQQPLYQALAAYERQFMLYLAQGRVLADGADMRLVALRQCIQEQAIMCRALRAAVSNLSDHFAAAARTRAEFSVIFASKTSNHSNLLQRFESIMNQELANIPLHPALVAIARASGRNMHSLLDTVPVERERAWAMQCQNSHQRLVALFSDLEKAFNELGTTADRQEESKKDLQAEQDVEDMWAEAQGDATKICTLQAQRLEQLTSGHREVVKIITSAIHSDPNEIQNSFSPLQELSNKSKDVVPSMSEDDNKLKLLMERVASAKTEAMKRMKIRLREISVAQSSIQRTLLSVGVLRDALTQQTENMVHLEHVSELANSYRHFLTELQRRRAYGKAVTASSIAMMERLASMRADEVKAREKFLRGPGRHLMPAFFDLFVPTLATPPPLFTPQLPAMVELDTLPDVSDAEFAVTAEAEKDDSGSVVMQQSTAAAQSGQGSASTLTVSATDSQQQQSQGSDQDGRVERQQRRPSDQLIVSADEASGADLILDPAADAAVTAVADAEMKTLAYENAVLRQALERMGGKPPKSYIEESMAKDKKGGDVAHESELGAIRKELKEAKSRARIAEEALQVANVKEQESGPSDKISHSSFAVGDVGLFMPTGRGSGGKRTYLAFHTNCPHRYLSTDCVKGSPDYVLGRIVYQEELVAGEVGTDANPYGLHVGTPFWVLTVEVLTPKPTK